MKLYAKKLWSINPKLYKYIDFESAMRLYEDYRILICRGRKTETVKSFSQWLKTEI
jgi:hypothetical protein